VITTTIYGKFDFEKKEKHFPTAIIIWIDTQMCMIEKRINLGKCITKYLLILTIDKQKKNPTDS